VTSDSGALLWEFQTETSRRNADWILTAERKFNAPFFFPSAWREAPIVATARHVRERRDLFVAAGRRRHVYFGSTDGALYALE
jgi:hypothetical protein